MACSVPARGPPSGRSTCASRRAAGRHAGDGAERLLARTRLDHRQLAAGERGELVGKVARRAVVVDAVGEPDTTEAAPAPPSAAAIACAAAMRSGAKGWGCTAAAVERAAAGASILG